MQPLPLNDSNDPFLSRSSISEMDKRGLVENFGENVFLVKGATIINKQTGLIDSGCTSIMVTSIEQLDPGSAIEIWGESCIC
jgi:hypothetical protein